jgi:predicted enzyme related to lactoylglutathione lyase
MTFEQLDYIYTPTRDAAADVAFYTEVLGGQLVFAIDEIGTRVAMVALTDGPPRILLAEHLAGERPVLVYRVEDLDETLSALETRGWVREGTLEIPTGPCCSFRSPGGHRIAVYQRTRGFVEDGFAGRRDF